MEHPLWPAFEDFAVENGIDFTYEDDWKVWWECFLAGSIAGIKSSIQSQFAPIQHEIDQLAKEVESATNKKRTKNAR